MDRAAPDLGKYSAADLAAGIARLKWEKRAKSKARMGKQMPPDSGWHQLIFKAGRGWGKSESLVQWLWWECWRVSGIIGHAVGPTIDDMRKVLFLGPVGFKSIIPPECLYKGSFDEAFDYTHHELTFANGSQIIGFGASDGARKLRGPQCHAAIGDEIREWDRPAGMLEDAHSNLMFGVRLPYPDGTPARALFGTTPKAIPYLLNLYKRKDIKVVTGTSYENISNLSESYKNQLLSMEGTQIGRVEIHAEDTNVDEMAILKRNWFKLWPATKKLPEFSFVLESYDTASSEEDFDKKKQTRDPTACSIWGVFSVAQNFTPEEVKRLRIRSRYAVLLCDVWTDYLGLPELLEKARKQHRIKWGSPGRRSDVVLIEDKSSGIQMRQMLTKYGVPSFPYNPGQASKTMRGHTISPYVAQGLLFVPESGVPERKGQPRDWVEPFLQEVCAFAGPGSTPHDDQYDTLTQAIIYLKDRALLEIKPEEMFVDYEEKRERDQKAALKIHQETRERVSPYGS